MLEEIRQILTLEGYQLVISDEANVAVWFGLFGVEELLALIDVKPERVELCPSRGGVRIRA